MTTSTEQADVDRYLAQFKPSYEFFSSLRENGAGAASGLYSAEESQSSKIDTVVNKMDGAPVIRMVFDQKSKDPEINKKLKKARDCLTDIGTIQTGFVRQAASGGHTEKLTDSRVWLEAYNQIPLMNSKLNANNEVNFACKAAELSTQMLTALVGFAVGADTVAATAFKGFLQELGDKLRLRQEKSGNIKNLILPNSRAVYNTDIDEVEAWHNLYTIDAKHSQEIIKINCGSVEMVNLNIKTTQIIGKFEYGILDRRKSVSEKFEKWADDHLDNQFAKKEKSFHVGDIEKKS